MLIADKIKNTQKYIAYLLPITIVTGSFLADLSISLIGILFVVLTINNKDLKYYKYWPVIIFWIWCLYLILNSSLSANPFLSLESSLFYFRFGLFSLGIWYILDCHSEFRTNFLKICLAVFVVVLFDGYLEFFYGSNLLNYQYNGERIQGLFGDNFLIGSYLSRFLPLIFALFYSEISKSNKSLFLFMALLVLTDLLVYLSGERTSFLIVTLVSICIIVLTSKYRMIRFVTFIISIMLIVVITNYKENIKNRMIDKTIKQTNILGDKVYTFSPRHEAFYSTSINIFEDNYLFGVGPKLYRIYCNDPKYSTGKGCSTHPHNTYMQLLSETGIIGTLPIVLLFLYVCLIFLKQLTYMYFKKSIFIDDHRICLYIAIFITLWPFAPSQNFFNNWISIMYFLPIGFLLHSNFRVNKF